MQDETGQLMLPTFDLSENDMMRIAMAQPLDDKIDRAVKLLQAMAPLDGSPYTLAYSGGKDSDCILELAKMAGVPFRAVYSVTTMDPPELVRYIKREHPYVEFRRHGKHMMTRFVEKTCGPPTRRSAWCCEEYKEATGNGSVCVVGVRAEESPKRAMLWKSVVQNRRMGTVVCPVVYWTERDVWEFHGRRKLSYCCLYDEGFTRLGCVGCPKAGKAQQDIEFARWPRYETMWKRAFERYWKRWYGVPTNTGKKRKFEEFGSWQKMYHWWRNDQCAERAECQTGWLFG